MRYLTPATPAIAGLIVLATALLGNIQAAKADLADGISAYDGGDYGIALKEFMAAAEAGDPAAQLALASMYHHGEGVPRDMGRAVAWYRAAAERGDAVAQVNLAQLVRDGHGVPRDMEAALFWVELAARAGNAWAHDARAAFAAGLDDSARNRVTARIANWHPFTGGETISGEAVVHDAATLSIGAKRYRLPGIVVHPLGLRCTVRGNEHDCGYLSSTALMDITVGATVVCAPRVRSSGDGTRYAFCQADGYDLSFGMIYAGWAWAADTAQGLYRRTEEKARAARRGLWHD